MKFASLLRVLASFEETILSLKLTVETHENRHTFSIVHTCCKNELFIFTLQRDLLLLSYYCGAGMHVRAYAFGAFACMSANMMSITYYYVENHKRCAF